MAGKPIVLGFWDGFRCLFFGLRMVYVTHRELAKYYLIPMILAFLLIGGTWALFWHYSDDLVNWVWTEPSMDAWWGMKHLLWRLAAVAVFLAGVVVTAVSSTFLFSLLTASVNDLFSEKVEGILGTWAPRDFSIAFLLTDLAQTLKFELIRFAMKVAWLLPLFILSFIVPVAGHLVYLTVGGYFLCKYTGMDYVDWPSARRGRVWKERLLFAKVHRAAVAGLGAGVVLSLFVPLLFVVIWPGAVAGGTILFLKIENELKGNDYV